MNWVRKTGGKVRKYKLKEGGWLKSHGPLHPPEDACFSQTCFWLISILWDRREVEGFWPHLCKSPKAWEKQSFTCRSHQGEKPWSRGAPSSLIPSTSLWQPHSFWEGHAPEGKGNSWDRRVQRDGKVLMYPQELHMENKVWLRLFHSSEEIMNILNGWQ